jgi:outer membrane protein OmpA-like peptidoglycan-associated protein
MLKRTIISSAVFIFALPALCQETAPRKDGAPLYNVTVVDRTTKAINYQYRQGPTKIDFRGTVLLPHGKGEATVESKRGRTEIDAKFENLASPEVYGREYLTYTLWAITPEGAARNLGEIVPGSSNKARLHVTTDLQAFGLIVTAEPYSAARRPSDVVVLENEIRPDTLGTIQPINAKYELMPRGHYTWHVPDQMEATVANAQKVSMSKYEAMLAVYEAQNALGIARAAGADTYAAATFQKAQAQFEEAKRLEAGKSPASKVVQDAREAAQTAEDARVIAERRHQEEQLAAAQTQAAQAQQAKIEAQAEAQKAIAEAQAARAQADAERTAREQAEAAARAAEARPVTTSPAVMKAEISAPPAPDSKAELRRRLNTQLNGLLSTRDTPRGLVVTLGDPAFRGTELKPGTIRQVSQVAAIVARYPGLRVEVEGFSDATGSSSSARAEAVRNILLDQGLAPGSVTARGRGDSRPLVSNATARGREQNRRVEVVISGDPIGRLASWDRTYNLAPAGYRR